MIGTGQAEQARSGFGYGYSVYQAEYSRNLAAIRRVAREVPGAAAVITAYAREHDYQGSR
jgi:hypothetical protein